MPLDNIIDQRLAALLAPYESDDQAVTSKSFIIKDLGVSGSDFIDLISDIEKQYGVDMTDFLMGDNPEYVSAGLIGRLMGKPRKPIFRDVTVEEINAFVMKRH